MHHNKDMQLKHASRQRYATETCIVVKTERCFHMRTPHKVIIGARRDKFSRLLRLSLRKTMMMRNHAYIIILICTDLGSGTGSSCYRLYGSGYTVIQYLDNL
jgi:hypothetical protein